MRVRPRAASSRRRSKSGEGAAIHFSGCTPRRTLLMKGPSKCTPRISARGWFATPLFACAAIASAIPETLRQSTSGAAVTVVARKEVVPPRASVAATTSSASGVPRITSWPPAPWTCTSTKPGVAVALSISTKRAPRGMETASRVPTARMRPSSSRITALGTSSVGVIARSTRMAVKGIEDHILPEARRKARGEKLRLARKRAGPKSCPEIPLKVSERTTFQRRRSSPRRSYRHPSNPSP